MYRIRVDTGGKFQHVLSRLQAMVTDTYKTCTPTVLPKYVLLNDIDKIVKDNLKVKLDSVYREKEITVVVSLEHNEDKIYLMGVAKRSWKHPTLSPS